MVQPSSFEIELVYALAANDRLSDALDVVKRHDAVPMEAGVAIAQCLDLLPVAVI